MSPPQTSGAPPRGRPLSPHISIYRMSRYSLLSSISNRFAGLALSLGLLLLLYWLISLAGGAGAYADARAVLSSVPLKVIYALLALAFAYHLCAGVRHLIWDTGHGLSRQQSQRSARWLLAISLLIAALLIWWALFSGAGAQ